MNCSTTTTDFNCGIDLHGCQLNVCVMDRQDKKLVHTNVKNYDFEFFLKLVAPYRHDLTVCAEYMFDLALGGLPRVWTVRRCWIVALEGALGFKLYRPWNSDCPDGVRIGV
jgi:hypothetical protein